MTPVFPIVTTTSTRRRDRLLNRRREAYVAISCDLYLLTASKPPTTLSDFRGATLFPLQRGHTTVITPVDNDVHTVRITSSDARPASLTLVCETATAAIRLCAAVSAAVAPLTDLHAALLARRRGDPVDLREALAALQAPPRLAGVAVEEEQVADIPSVVDGLTNMAAVVKGTVAACALPAEWTSALADAVLVTQHAMHVFECVFGALPIAAPIIQIVGLAADVALLAVERGEREAEMRALSARCAAVTRDIVSGLFFSMDYTAVEDAAVHNLFAVMHKVCELAREAERFVMKGRGMQMLTVDQVSTLSAQVAEIETLVTSLRILQYVQENHARNQRVDESAKDVYRRSLLVTPPTLSSAMLFECEDTPEAMLRDKLFDESCTSGLVGAVGMTGVGKTSILTAIANEPSIRRYFDGGIYQMRLGPGCSGSSVISQLAGVVERSGGAFLAEKIRSTEDLERAVLIAKDWFFAHRCLFIWDDAQETEESPSGFVRELRGIVDLTVGSRAIFSTCSRTLAYAAANRRDIVDVEPRHMTAASQILCKHADIDFSFVNEMRHNNPASKDLRAFDTLVESCGGLPVCLGVVGKAIAERPRRDNENPLQACRALVDGVCETGRLHREALATMTLENYLGFGKTIDAMWEALEQSDLLVGRYHASDLHEMNNGLCVLQSSVWTPAFVLKRLWGIGDDQVQLVILALEAFSLLKTRHGENGIEVWIHRLMLEYCTHCAKKDPEMPPNAWHSKLLASYMDTIDTKHRPWWTCEDIWDGYMRANLVRHLVLAGVHEELRALLLDFRWIQRCVDSPHGNIYSALDLLEKDYRMALPDASSGQIAIISDGRVLQELGVSLSLIADSLRLSRDSLVRRPGDVSFQMVGRLVSMKDKPDIAAFLRSVQKYASRPTVWSVRPSLTPVDGPLVQTIDIGWSIYAMTVIPKSSRILIGGKGGAAIVDLQRGEVVRVLRESKGWNDAVESVATTKHGTHAVCGWADGKVSVWDLRKAESKMLCFEVGKGEIYVAVTGDGKRVVTGDGGGEIAMWDLMTGAMVEEPTSVHRLAVRCLCLKPGENIVTSGSRDGSVFSLELSGKSLVEVEENARGDVWCVAWTPRSERIVVGSEFEKLLVYRSIGGKDGEYMKGVAHSVVSVQVSDDNDVLVCGSMNGNLYVCDADWRKTAFDTLIGHTKTVSAVGFDWEGKHIVSGSKDGTIRTWRIPPTCAIDDGHARTVCCLAADAAEEMMASGSYDGSVRIWSMENGELCAGPLQSSGAWAAVRSVGWSLDGSLLASGHRGGAVRIWSMQSETCTHGALEGHRRVVRSVAFSRDGTLLASGGEDNTVRVWDVASGTALHTLCGHRNWVTSVCFSSDGVRVASGSFDKTARVWEARSGASIGDKLPVGDRVVSLRFVAGDSALCVSGQGGKEETFEVVHGTRVDADEGEKDSEGVKKLVLKKEHKEVWDGFGKVVARLDYNVSAGPVVDARRGRVWVGLERGTVACVELVGGSFESES